MKDSDAEAIVSEVEAIAQRHIDAGTEPTTDLIEFYESFAKQIIDFETDDLAMRMLPMRRRMAMFEAHVEARWGGALDLLDLLLRLCWETGAETTEHYSQMAAEKEDHRFEALVRLHARATLTLSEIIALLRTGHSTGAMGRWRTLHEVDVTAAFLSMQDDVIAYRFLRYEDAQTLKLRRAYDRYHKQLGYEPTDPAVDGDPEELKKAIVEEFGVDFLDRNGWAIPAFGHRPKDDELERAADLEHYRPYVYLAADSVHATPKGLRITLQQVGDEPMIMAGPSNAGLADPGHNAALSAARTTITLVNYCGMEMNPDPTTGELASGTVTALALLDLSERIGGVLLEAAQRLDRDEADDEAFSASVFWDEPPA